MADRAAQGRTTASSSPRDLARSGLALAVGSALLFSTKAIFIKLNYGYDIDGITQLVLRMGFALLLYLALGLYAFSRRRRRGEPTDLSARTIAQTCAVGLLGYYFSVFVDFQGLRYITAQFEQLLLYAYPTFVAILGYVLFRHRLKAAQMAALGLTYAGLVVVFVENLVSLGDQVLLGASLVLTSSITYALYLVLARPLIARIGSQLFIAISMIFGTCCLITHFLIVNGPAAILVPAPVLGFSLGMAILATFLPSVLVSEAIARIGPVSTSIAGGVGPIATSLLAVLILGEPFTLAQALGTLLVIAGVVVLTRMRSLPP
ncbi:MAG: DMT family transporter [Hyphomicrobiaceae bacterium]